MIRKYPSISVVFPNLNGNKQDLYNLLTSLQKSNYPSKQLEFIMVDNGSTDDSVQYVLKKFPEVKIIKLENNCGFAKAVNIGIENARSECVFVTNNDVVLEKECLKNLAEYFIAYPKVGVIGPKVYFRNQPKKIASGALKYNFYTGLFSSDQTNKINQKVDWISGCGMFFSKNIWIKLGGFDENFFFIGEDLDFCLRIKYLGFKVTYYPKAVIWHSDGATVNRPELLYLKYFEGYKSKLRVILKHGNPLQILTSFLLQFAVFAPYRTLILQEKSLIPLYNALIWNIKHLRQTLAARRKLRVLNA